MEQITQWDKKIKARDFMQRPWYSNALELLKKISDKNKEIVEFGCGNGEFGKLIKSSAINYKSYLGLDGFAPSLEKARNEGLDVLKVNFEEDIPVKEKSVDIAISLEVIEHIADAEGFISKIHRVLKDSGYLILSTPNVGFWRFRWRYLIKAEVAQEGIHLRFFNQKKLLLLLENEGFTLVDKKSIKPDTFNNAYIKLFGGKRKHLTCSPKTENILGLHFIWLLKK